MKKVLFFVVAMAANYITIAQVSNFKITPDSLVVDAEASEDGIKLDFEVKNLSKSPRTIVWERLVVGITKDWETSVCDPENCFGPPKSSSEFLLQGDGVGAMVLDAYPYGKAGFAYVKMKFYDKAMPTAASFARFRFNAKPLNIAEASAEKLRVFPNPTSDMFVLEGNAPVETVQIVNMMGQVVKTFNYTENDIYEVQDLIKGTYMINLIGEGQKRLAVKRLVKQ
jgi:hypothetical protein